MVGFDDLYRQGGAVTWQAGKRDVVRQVVGRLMNLTDSSRVLDFGCGTGWSAEILIQAGGRYLGIDPSSEGIGVAVRSAEGNPHIRFQQLAIDESLSEALLGAKFTHIFALDALYFVPDLQAAARALLDCLEPGGSMTTISHIYRESGVADSLIDAVTRDHGLPHFLSGVQWQIVLERAGWTDVCRYRFYNRRPFDPSEFLGHPQESIRLARLLYEREGALVITCKKAES